MADQILFKSDRNDLDGRSLCVTAERGYGDVIIFRVSDDGGEIAIYLHDADEAIWLGDALMVAGKAIAR